MNKFGDLAGLSYEAVAIELIDCSHEFRIVGAGGDDNRYVHQLGIGLNKLQHFEPGNPGLRQVQKDKVGDSRVTVLTGPMQVVERIRSVFYTMESAGYANRVEGRYREQGIGRIALNDEDIDLRA